MGTSSFIRKIRKAIRTLRELYGSHAWSLGILGLFGLFNGLLGATGIGVLIPLFSFLTTRSLPDTDPVSRALGWLFARLDFAVSVSAILAVIVVLFFLKAAAFFFFKYAGARVVSGFEADLRGHLYRTTLGSSWPLLLRQKIGHLENILMTQVGGLIHLLSGILSTIHNLTSCLMYLVVAFAISPVITGAALAGGALVILFSKPIFRRIRIYAREQAVLQKGIAHEINENVSGLKVIKALAAEDPVAKTGVDFFISFRRNRVRMGTIKSFMAALPQPISLIFVSAAFLVSMGQPGFNLVSFLAVMYLIQQIFGFAEKIQGSLSEVNGSLPYVHNTLAFLREVRAAHERSDGIQPFAFERDIAFRNVRFGYGGKSVLTGFTCVVRRGEMVGIIGPSGVGKTTIADLLLRLFEPQEGEILADGVPIREIDLGQWRRSVGYVPQDIFLKNDTAAANIRFFDERVTQRDIEEAARLSHIDEVIRALPQGYETVVGERGVLLSAGQRQRIALARVLARKPKLLILDEATSALDNESEQIIRQALLKLKSRMTIVIIAHRLSTVMECDRVTVLAEGKTAEEGNPYALRSRPETLFSRMYRAGERADVAA